MAELPELSRPRTWIKAKPMAGPCIRTKPLIASLVSWCWSWMVGKLRQTFKELWQVLWSPLGYESWALTTATNSFLYDCKSSSWSEVAVDFWASHHARKLNCDNEMLEPKQLPKPHHVSCSADLEVKQITRALARLPWLQALEVFDSLLARPFWRPRCVFIVVKLVAWNQWITSLCMIWTTRSPDWLYASNWYYKDMSSIA